MVMDYSYLLIFTIATILSDEVQYFVQICRREGAMNSSHSSCIYVYVNENV